MFSSETPRTTSGGLIRQHLTPQRKASCGVGFNLVRLLVICMSWLGCSACIGSESWQTPANPPRPAEDLSFGSGRGVPSRNLGVQIDSTPACYDKTCQTKPEAARMRIYSVKGKKGTRWGVDYVDDRGRRVRKVVADSKAQAEGYLARVRVALDRGTYNDPGRYDLTMAELVPICRTKMLRRLEPEVQLLQRVVRMIGPDFEVRRLRLEHWEDVRAQLEIEGAMKPASRNRYLSALRSTVRLAVRRGQLGEDPLKHARFEREDNARRRLISEAEEARLWGACKGVEDRAMLALALYAAARRSELHRARFEHFDAPARTWWLPDTKSGKPRTLPLPQLVLDEVWRLQTARGAGPKDPLFLGKVHCLSARFVRLRDRAGLEDLGLHDLRRTAATRAITAGVPLPTVMSVLGHTSLASTSRYVAITAEHSRAFAEALPQRPRPIPPDDTA